MVWPTGANVYLKNYTSDVPCAFELLSVRKIRYKLINLINKVIHRYHRMDYSKNKLHPFTDEFIITKYSDNMLLYMMIIGSIYVWPATLFQD